LVALGAAAFFVVVFFVFVAIFVILVLGDGSGCHHLAAGPNRRNEP
jgi:hypothetical protein